MLSVFGHRRARRRRTASRTGRARRNRNRGGEQGLRKLELRCLDAGIIVARTSDDLVRYHDKYILVDRRTLYMLSFNFTHLDIDHRWIECAIHTRDPAYRVHL